MTQDHFVWVYTWNWFDRDHFILYPLWEHVISKPPSTACCQQRCKQRNTEAQEPVRDHFRNARTEAGQKTPGAASVHPTPSCHSHPGCLRFAHFPFPGIWNSSALQTPPHTRDREHCLCSGNVHASFRSAAVWPQTEIMAVCLGQGLQTHPVDSKTDPRVGCRPQRLSRGIGWQGSLKGPRSEGMHSKEQNGLAQESSMHSHRGRATQLLGGQTTEALLKCLDFTFYVYWALTKKHRITTNLGSQVLNTTSTSSFHRGAKHLGWFSKDNWPSQQSQCKHSQTVQPLQLGAEKKR